MRNLLKDAVTFLRIKHWVKNIFVFAPLLFAWKITEPAAVVRSLLAFLAFCLISSVIYIINDVHDVEADKKHPKKCQRPIASGRIGLRLAVVLALLIMCGALLLSWLVNPFFLIATAAYLLLNFFYTFKGKHMVIIDAFCIALGFVLRVVGGAYAIQVTPSGWIIMTTFFLCLFMGFGKRRNELLALKEEGEQHRSVLALYSHSMLNQFILSSATIAIISYTLYTLSPAVDMHFHTGDKLIVTVPFVTFVIFKYTYLIWSREEGDPTDVILRDPSLIIAGLLWLFVTLGIIYYSLQFGG